MKKKHTRKNDDVIGQCARCSKPIVRDAPWTMFATRHFVCVPCYETGWRPEVFEQESFL